MPKFNRVQTHLLMACCMYATVRAEWWDDFSNNLATDLAPLLALLGEQVTKQFLSESTTTLDNFIFAMAPLGIITAVVSAIRVCGGPSLRAFIGRAQEGGGIAEAELCSSTSRDVCELYHNGAIVRVFGRPKILEIVHDRESTDFYQKPNAPKPAYGIYYFRDYMKTDLAKEAGWRETTTSAKGYQHPPIQNGQPASTKERSVSTYFHDYSKIGRTKKAYWERKERNNLPADGDIESDQQHPLEDGKFAPNPNLSLNIGISKRSSYVYWLAAGAGFISQSSVIIFGGFATYYWQWEKQDAIPRAWAFPLMVVGSMILSCGMFYCAYLIEKSTKERVFHKHTGKSISSKPPSIYITQPGNQTIGDQTYDSFAFSDSSEYSKPLETYITSWKVPPRPGDQQRVCYATALTIVGFSFQFIGLRAMHSSVSVALLAAIVIMSFVRSGLRTGRLKKEQNLLSDCSDFTEGHELDWLAMQLGRPGSLCGLSANILRLSPRASQESQDNGLRICWSIVSGTTLQPTASSPTEPDSGIRSTNVNIPREEIHGSKSRIMSQTEEKDASILHFFTEGVGSPELKLAEAEWLSRTECHFTTKLPRSAARLFYYRSRLAEMTQHSVQGHKLRFSTSWDDQLVPFRRQVQQLKQAIETSAQIMLFHARDNAKWKEASSLAWGMNVAAFSSTSAWDGNFRPSVEAGKVHVIIRRVILNATRSSATWEVDHASLEAILGLWIWSIVSDPFTTKRTRDGLQISAASEVSRARIIAVETNKADMEIARMEFQHWSHESLTSTKIWKVEASEPYLGVHNVWCPDDSQESLSSRFSRNIPQQQLLRLFGWPKMDFGNEESVLVVGTTQSIPTLCAQDVYQYFVSAMATMLDFTGGSKGLAEPNEMISKLVTSVTESGLGSRQDAFLTILPALSRQRKLPIPTQDLPEIYSIADQRRLAGRFEHAENILQWAWRLGLHAHRTQQPNSAENLAATAFELGELYRNACRASYVGGDLSESDRAWHESFGIEGISSLKVDANNLVPATSIQITNRVARYVEFATLWKENPSRTNKINEALEAAIEDKRALCLWHLSRAGYAQAADDDGRTIISWASQRGWPEVVKASLEMGFAVDTKDLQEARTPLSFAAEYGHVDVLRILLENKSLPDARGGDGRTPLSYASQKSRLSAIMMLCKDGRVDFEAEDMTLMTPMRWAAASGHCGAIKLLHSYGAAVDTNDRSGKTPPFVVAIQSKQERAALQLLKLGARGLADFVTADNLSIWELALHNRLWSSGEYFLRTNSRTDSSRRNISIVVVAQFSSSLPYPSFFLPGTNFLPHCFKFMALDTDGNKLNPVTVETLRMFVRRQMKACLRIHEYANTVHKKCTEFTMFDNAGQGIHDLESERSFTYALRIILRRLSQSQEHVYIPQDVLMTAVQDHTSEILRLLLKAAGPLLDFAPGYFEEVLKQALENRSERLEYLLDWQESHSGVSGELLRTILRSEFCDARCVRMLLKYHRAEAVIAEEISLTEEQVRRRDYEDAPMDAMERGSDDVSGTDEQYWDTCVKILSNWEIEEWNQRDFSSSFDDSCSDSDFEGDEIHR